MQKLLQSNQYTCIKPIPSYPLVLLFFLTMVFLVAGCSSRFEKHFDDSVTLAETCRGIDNDILGAEPISWKSFIELIALRVGGEVSFCPERTKKEGPQEDKTELNSYVPVLLCGLDQAVYDGLPNIREEMLKSRLEYIENFRTTLGKEIKEIKDNFSKLLDPEPKEGQVDIKCIDINDCMKTLLTDKKIDKVGSILKSIYHIENALDILEKHLTSFDEKDSQRRQLLMIYDSEIRAYVSNARVFLKKARQALNGDVLLLTRDFIRSNVYYQISSRMLDVFDSSLGSVETLLNRADDKAYGSVSLVFYFTESEIQKKFDTFYNNRLDELKSKYKDDVRYVARAMARAACDKFEKQSSSNKVSLLTPFFHKAFIRGFKNETDSKLIDEKNQYIPFSNLKDKSLSSEGEKKDDISATSSLVDSLSTAKLYLNYEWFSRDKLIERHAESEQDLDPDSTKDQVFFKGSGTPKRLPNFPDENLVEQIAFSMSSNAVEQIWRQDLKQVNDFNIPIPYFTASMAQQLAMQSMNTSSQIINFNANSVSVNPDNVPTPPSSVYNAYVTTNLSKHEHPDFQGITPIIHNHNYNYIDTSTKDQLDEINFCKELSTMLVLDKQGATDSDFTCIKRANGHYVIQINQYFDTGEWNDLAKDNNINQVLKAVGKSSVKFPKKLAAFLTGYASRANFTCEALSSWSKDILPEGLSLTKVKTVPHSYLLNYKSRSGMETKRQIYCGLSRAEEDHDGNNALSFTRAAWAADRLEVESNGTIQIRDIEAYSYKYSDPGNRKEDRRLKIELIEN